jgi:S-adenosyl methyltransferase
MSPPAHAARRQSSPPPASPAPHIGRRPPSGNHLPDDQHSWEARAGILLTCGDAEARSIFSELTCISHLTAVFAPEAVSGGVQAYNRLVPTAVFPRSHTQVAGLFAGLSLVAPGAVPISEWGPDPVARPVTDFYGGVGRVCPHQMRPHPAATRSASCRR